MGDLFGYGDNDDKHKRFLLARTGLRGVLSPSMLASSTTSEIAADEKGETNDNESVDSYSTRER